jgi:probable HAF family extracellular repeat protein
MKFKALTWMMAVTVVAVLAALAPLAAQTTYKVVKLEGLGGDAGANGINNRGWATGQANNATNTITRAALWVRGSAAIDLGTLGGPATNSIVAFPVKSDNGLIVGISDTNTDHPLGNAFSCWPFYAAGTPTRKICNGFRWVKGQMTPLPAFPGGYSSYATGANNRGQVVGWAENGVHDPSCDTNFQVLGFTAVIWQPDGSMQPLPPLPGDSTSAATAINDKGQVVGISGACGIAVGGVSAAHSVIWENGVPINIGDLGGHTWNTPTAINNDGVVVGFSLPADQEGTRFFEAFVWTKDTGIKRLAEIPGDVRSSALGINGDGQIVGFSRTPDAVLRAVKWENADAPITNLNDVVSDESLYLAIAGDINNAGTIAGFAFDPATLESPAFIATPGEGEAPAASKHSDVKMPDKVRQRLLRKLGLAVGSDE